MRAMGAAKSGGQEVRVGQVFMECAEKKEFPGFGFFWQGANCALWGRRRLREAKMQLAGSKDGGWGYTDRHPGSKMEILVIMLKIKPPPKSPPQRATGQFPPMIWPVGAARRRSPLPTSLVVESPSTNSV